jgi:hypothetical protein
VVERWIEPWVARGELLAGVLRLCDGNELRAQLMEVASQPRRALKVGLSNLNEQIEQSHRVAELLRAHGGDASSAELLAEVQAKGWPIERMMDQEQLEEDHEALVFFVQLTEAALAKAEREERQKRAEGHQPSGHCEHEPRPGDAAWRTAPTMGGGGAAAVRAGQDAANAAFEEQFFEDYGGRRKKGSGRPGSAMPMGRKKPLQGLMEDGIRTIDTEGGEEDEDAELSGGALAVHLSVWVCERLSLEQMGQVGCTCARADDLTRVRKMPPVCRRPRRCCC